MENGRGYLAPLRLKNFLKQGDGLLDHRLKRKREYLRMNPKEIID